VRDSAGDFSFAVVADRTCCMKPGVFEDAVQKLNTLRPAFVISVGDHIPGYTDDPKEAEAEWREFEGIIAKLNCRFYYTPGNHDLESAILPGIWKQRRGATHYSFAYKNVLFLVLNSNEGGWAKISPEQSDWARKVLESNKGVKWTFVFMHHPIWTGKDLNGFAGIEKALGTRPYTVFAGHEHAYRKYVRNGRNHYVLATTGGGSDMRGPGAGEFDQIAWVSVSGAEPAVTNLALDGIYSDDVVDAKSAGLMDKLKKGAVLQVTNLTLDKDTVSVLDMQWKAANEADIPLKVSVDIRPSCQLRGSADHVEAVVAPGKEGSLGVSFKSPVELPLKGLEPIRYEWKSEYQPEGKPPVSAGGTASIVFDRPCFVSPRASRPAVDGNLADWAGFSYGKLAPLTPQKPSLWKDKNDCAFRFAANNDKDCLYLALDVVDDSMVAQPGTDPWNQDGFGFYIYGLPLRDAEAKDLGKYHAVYASPGSDMKSTILWGTQWLASGIEVACVVKPGGGGWTAEIAIPVKHLDLSSGRPWEKLRLNVCVYDFDKDTRDEGTYMWWRPSWDSPENNPGSGTFYRGKAVAAGSGATAPVQSSTLGARKDAGTKDGVLDIFLGWFGIR
jgi:hypothetical protein